MGLPRFFNRVYAAAGGVLSLSAESLERQLGAISIGVALDTEWEGNPNAEWTAELIVNLCARLYGELSLIGPPTWRARAESLARAINPNVSISSTSPTITLIVGNQLVHGETLYARADGWVARVSSGPIGGIPAAPNPVAAGAAASLAVAELFRRTFQAHVPKVPFKDISISLLDFTEAGGINESLTAAAIGSVGLVGLGAVGNGAVWCLSKLQKLTGSIELIDGQAIDESNLQRYVLALDAHIAALKTHLASEALSSTGVHLIQRTMSFEEAADLGLPDTLAVSVDNVPTRRAVQAMLPRLAINGWTSERGLGASWHYFAESGPCLACEYQPRGRGRSQTQLVSDAFGIVHERVAHLWVNQEGLSSLDLETATQHLKLPRGALRQWLNQPIQKFYTDVMCGQVALDLSGVGRLEAVPLAHQSALAGILMAAELIRRTDPRLAARSSANPMVVWDDVLHIAPKIWTQVRAARAHCICSDEAYRRRYREKWLRNVERTADLVGGELVPSSAA